MDLAVTAKPLEGLFGGRAELVLHGDTGNEARIQIFDVDRILVTSNAVFLAPFGGDKVICCHNFTPFSWLSLVRTCEVALGIHLALDALLAICVERLVTEKMLRRMRLSS